MPGTSSDVRQSLAPRAFLYDDPGAYLAGVEDALAATTAADGDPSRTGPASGGAAR